MGADADPKSPTDDLSKLVLAKPGALDLGGNKAPVPTPTWWRGQEPADQHLIPMQDDIGLAEIEHALGTPTRWGTPAMYGFLGRDDGGRRLASIQLEYPEQLRMPRKRATAERHQMERFEVDLARARIRPWARFERGKDPPDFVAYAEDGASLGIEITQFVVEHRAALFGASRGLLTAALLRGPQRFRHLEGQIVYVAFRRDTVGRLSRQVEAALDAIESMEAPRPGVTIRPQPQREPLVSSWDNGIAMGFPLMRGHPAPTSAFYGTMGFDLVPAIPSLIYQDDAWAQLQRRVTEHDKPGVDVLIVISGAPLPDGWVFPTDLLIQTFAIECAEDGRTLEAEHISRVFLHDWTLRQVVFMQVGVADYRVLCQDEALVQNPPAASYGITLTPDFGVPVRPGETRSEW